MIDLLKSQTFILDGARHPEWTNINRWVLWFQIVVEGVKQGPTQSGDMAFDDVQVTHRPCPPPGYCDFESSLCDWSSLGGGVAQEGWLRGRGASPHPSSGPNIDHTTNSDQGNQRS